MDETIEQMINKSGVFLQADLLQMSARWTRIAERAAEMGAEEQTLRFLALGCADAILGRLVRALLSGEISYVQFIASAGDVLRAGGEDV